MPLNERLSVLLVEDNESDVAVIRRLLDSSEVALFNLVVVNSVFDAGTEIVKSDYDLCIIDHNLPDGTSDEILELISESEKNLPVTVTTSGLGLDLAFKVMNLGATDCLDKEQITPLNFDRFILLNIIRGRRHSRLVANATRDNLTGLYSREYFETHLEKMAAINARSNTPIAVLFVDLDGFKKINDEVSYNEGDRVIIKCARAIHDCTRQVDVVARWGGDEFVVTAFNSSADAAEILGRRIANTIRTISNEQELLTGASVGIAELNAESYSVKEVIANASMAMKVSKKSASEKVTIFGRD